MIGADLFAARLRLWTKDFRLWTSLARFVSATNPAATPRPNMLKQTILPLRNAARILFGLVLFANVNLRAFEPAKEIFLWPKGAPGSEGKIGDTVVRIADRGERVLSNIHKPSVTPYLPAADKATGCAVIVAPSGGHRELWSDHEGHNIARWLSERGIAAFVIKYRLARETNSTYTVDDHALADMQRALRLLRSRATEGASPPTASA